jgi:hypothetical protein
MLYVIDGTGSNSDKEYRHSMAHGFCRRMEREFGAQYFRGPNTLDFGKSTLKLAAEVYERIFEKITSSPDRFREPIFLAGHSRGGAAAIRVAGKLGDKGINVRALFLFDAVDRATDFTFTSQIPNNVEMTYHARRDPALAQYYEADLRRAEGAWRECVIRHSSLRFLGPLLDPSVLVYNTVFGDPKDELPAQCAKQTDEIRRLKLLDQKMKYAMRTSLVFDLDLVRKFGWANSLSIDFSNTGTIPPVSAGGKTTYIERKFRGSHGAIGGAPITDDRAPPILKEFDFITVHAVKAWMWTNFAAVKLGNTEKPGSRRTIPH